MASGLPSGVNSLNEEILKTLNVLYVEDEDLMRENMGMLLRRKVKSVEMAANGKEGLERFNEKRPDVVITDIEMPVMNGIEMIARIKEIDKSRPVIIITAFSDDMHKSELADARLIKPILKDDLFRAILDCVKK